MPSSRATHYPVITKIPPAKVAELDAIAAERGCSRFALMRDVLVQTDVIRQALRSRDLAERARIDTLLAGSDDLAAV